MTFGRDLLELWNFDPGITYLNHGTVGALPRRVREKQDVIRDRIERQPAQAMLRDIVPMVGAERSGPGELRAAAAEVAAFVGVEGNDLAFVDNATTGINAVLRSYPFQPGDEILVTDHAYGSVPNVAAFAARQHGASVRTLSLPHPPRDDAIVEAVAGALSERTRVAVIDHITSETALILPLARIAADCHAKGVAVLVDGAHAPGVLDLDLPALGVDWYSANLHKWAFAPRSAGFLWAPPERQADLHPPVVSWGLDAGFVAEFDWVGTRDPSPYLAAPEGLAMLRELGLDELRAYCHELAWSGGQYLCRALGTPFELDEHMVGSMITVPLPERLGTDDGAAARLRDTLLFEHRIEVAISAWRGRLWTRISAQVYNAAADIERLTAALAEPSG
jgi:isopenicillin-N epimerase